MKDGPLSNAEAEGQGSAAEDGQKPVGTSAHRRVWTFNDVGSNLGEGTPELGSGRRDGGNERKIPSPVSASGSIEHTLQDCLLQEELLIWFGSVGTPDSFL